MNENKPIKALFLDIGGVLLNNGWDRRARRLAADTFGIEYDEMDERHHLAFDAYETGKLSLDDYLKMVVFYRKRSFSSDEFKAFMYQQSYPLEDMIEFVCELKKQLGLKTVVVSNEGRELNAYRIHQFGLNKFIDTFISSSFVHFRKPDLDIYRIALDVAQVAPEEVVYLDDRLLFVEVARSLNIHSIQHNDLASTRAALAELGIRLPAGVV